MNLPEENDKIGEKIAELYGIANLYDVSFLVIKGSCFETFRANSFALSILSPYFSAVFTSGTNIGTYSIGHGYNELIIEDVHPKTFEKFLKFIHYKPIDISSVSDALDLYKVAIRFLVPRLQKYILSKYENGIEPTDVGRLFLFAQLYKLPNLCIKCLEIINFRTDEILQSYKKLHVNDFLIILRQKYLNVKEIDLFLAIQKWIAYRKKIGREISPTDQNKLKRLICFLNMSEEEIAIVAKTKFMSPEENQWFENYDVSKRDQYPSHLWTKGRIVAYMYSLSENFPKVKEKLTRSAIVLRTDRNIHLNRIKVFTQEGDPSETYMEDLTFIFYRLGCLRKIFKYHIKLRMYHSSIFYFELGDCGTLRKNVDYWMAFIKEEIPFEDPKIYYQTKLNGIVFRNRGVTFYLNRHILNYSPSLPVAGFEYSFL